jgi:hypothetical protein
MVDYVLSILYTEAVQSIQLYFIFRSVSHFSQQYKHACKLVKQKDTVPATKRLGTPPLLYTMLSYENIT